MSVATHVARLEAALRLFANRDNWTAGVVPDNERAVRGWAVGLDPWVIAEQALAGQRVPTLRHGSYADAVRARRPARPHPTARGSYPPGAAENAHGFHTPREDWPDRGPTAREETRAWVEREERENHNPEPCENEDL